MKLIGKENGKYVCHYKSLQTDLVLHHTQVKRPLFRPLPESKYNVQYNIEGK